MRDDDGYTESFLSPSKTPSGTRKRLSLFGRKNSREGQQGVSPSHQKRLGILATPSSGKRRSLFSRKQSPTTPDDGSPRQAVQADLSALLSPRLEQELQKRKKKNTFTPLNTLRTSTNNILRSSFHGILPFRADGSDGSDGSDDDGESFGDDDTEYEVEVEESESSGEADEHDDVEKIATEDDMMLLLCRELELMDGDGEGYEDEGYAYDSDD